jgi:acyl-CoA thioesterase I
MRMRSFSTFARQAGRLFLLVAVSATARPAAAAKVACVGDSITYGYGLANRTQQSWPAVLQTLVGTKHTVQNFGTSSCTLLKHGDVPYWNDANFGASDAFKPDVVIVMLGTNDAKPQNWSHKAEFAGDYQSMIEHYRALGALVYVAAPPPVYAPGAFDINPDVLGGEIVPLIRQIATTANAPLIDVFAALSGKANYFPDTVHPNAEGSQLIAQTVAAALQAGGFGGTGGSTGTGGATAGTGGSSGSGGATRGTGGGTTSTGGISGGGGATRGTGGATTTTTSSGGSVALTGGRSGTGGAGRGTGGATTSTGGVSGTGGATRGTGGSSTGTDGGVAGGGVSGTGGSVAQGGQSGSGGAAGGGSGGQAGSSAPAAGGNSGMVGASGGASSTAVKPTGDAGGCGCRLLGAGPVPARAWPMALLLLALARCRSGARRSAARPRHPRSSQIA